MRLQKYMADCGVCSRRAAEEMIRQGRVYVNGICIDQMGFIVNGGDEVLVDGKKIGDRSSGFVYVMLNKPKGYVTTMKDQFDRPSVVDLVKDINVRLFPVGRLDYASSGLLLMTNDGDLAQKMTHPSYKTEKKYAAKVRGLISENTVKAFNEGIMMEGKMTLPAGLKILKAGRSISKAEITLSEGRNRQIRKMFEAVGCNVLELRRTKAGPLSLGDLPEGKWRYLTNEEIAMIKN